ncbi:site-specific DNA-methyltransferase [Aeromonas caviae]|uniref:DNA methyltransferase n=1 Tax=Aeromonas caviae TaxID=648 RepID=UPI00244B1497|nr:DNA methyltransferase [Aeromonas caviae]MDH1847210.1 site-specific DNA-methyltransferase [Aeromonas caviae]
MQQKSLFPFDSPQQDQAAGPVICLGKTFANDQARRDYFLGLLAEKLQDPEFRKIEGFPIGNDEDILNLSDPPYYTACPNPWIGDFVSEWEAQKLASDNEYHREPFAADVSEGKNDPIYNAHPYHTKVPHKAIMRYILHYTKPGDIVFDGFCGSGMTGVAAQMCGDIDAVKSLGYQVLENGTIMHEIIGDNGVKSWQPFSKLGARNVILNDLSPAATSIANNYNAPVDIDACEIEVKEILREVEANLGWIYETTHSDGISKGVINYTVYSDVFICPECANEVIFWNAAVDEDAGKVTDAFPCPHCSAVLAKRGLERAWTNKFDESLNDNIKQAKQVPVLINYSLHGKRFEKKPDSFDFERIKRIEEYKFKHWYPSSRMMFGKESRRNDQFGLTHEHHFFSRGNLLILSAIRARINSSKQRNTLSFIFTSSMQYLNRLCRLHIGNHFHKKGGTVDKPLEGTLYFPSISLEVNALTRFKLRSRIGKSLVSKKRASVIGCSSSNSLSNIESESLDYIFIDPPFGANLNYSELNCLWESWLKLKTNISMEAIENSAQNKGVDEYRLIMLSCFSEAYRLLKPGRWMTIEFSNTKASVWNSIQVALVEAGFITANVSALDKKKGSFKAVTTPTAVKQDLVISAYKPSSGFENTIFSDVQTEEGVWDFIRSHLKYLIVSKPHESSMSFIPERDPRILFDKLVSYYVRKGYRLPIDSKEFQIGLSQRFSERDGMFFLPEQAAEYDRKKLVSGSLIQASLFVKDEATAIDWLRQLLKNKPQAFSDINPLYMQQLSGFSKHEVTLDLRELLSQNFLCYDGQDEVPEQIHSYLSSNWKELRNLSKNDPDLVAKAKERWYLPDPNKAVDLEKLREKSLLKEFDEYTLAKKKLKVFRIEAVRVGFKKLWEQQEFAALIAVAEKLPSNVLEEDPVLLMYYDQAVTLSQVDTDDEW